MTSPFDKDQIVVEEVSIQGGARRKLTDPIQTKSSLGVRIWKGKSLVTLSNLLSPEEVEYLVQSSVQAAADQNPNRGAELDRVCVRMPTRAAADRHDIPDGSTETLHDPLPTESSQFVEERILERALAYIDQQELCSSIHKSLFGHERISILELFQNQQLEWSTREPAINVYTQGGRFGMHKDNKALTILLPLSSPSEDFTGGGTAFWSQVKPNQGMDGPSLVMKPKAGTALLFGGHVFHQGLPIESGTRVVFVASFSKRSIKKAGFRQVLAR